MPGSSRLEIRLAASLGHLAVGIVASNIPRLLQTRDRSYKNYLLFSTVVICIIFSRFNREIDACFVPSDRLAVIARDCGLSPDQIRLHGLPIRPGFWAEQDANKGDLQKKLGLKPGVRACLVVGGGDGVGGLKGIADSVGAKLGEEKVESQVSFRWKREGGGA